MKLLYSTIIFAAVGLVTGSELPLEPASHDSRDHVIAAANSFSIDLYRAVSHESENAIISPLSAGVVFAMLWAGSNGTTAEQLAQVLHLSRDVQQVSNGYSQLLHELQNNDQLTLKIANKMYVQRDFAIKDSFREIAMNHFRSGAEEVNFVNDTESTRVAVNQWVEHNTNGKIKDLFLQGQLTQDSVLVLVNAIYFQANWVKVFEESDTRNEPFHVSHETQVVVPMMHGSFQMDYGSLPELNATVLMLVYKNRLHSTKMYILLPNAIDGLEYLESKLGDVDIHNINTLRYDVTVTLPKFRIEATHRLKEKLSELGASDVFSSAADLSGVSDANLHVSDAVQKTFISVDEKGTEAAAATGINIRMMSLFPRAEFTANHPFLFIVKRGNIILFIGKVTNPSI